MKYVAYYRVSTQKQGQSGLGLEAQRAAVLAFLGTLKSENGEAGEAQPGTFSPKSKSPKSKSKGTSQPNPDHGSPKPFLELTEIESGKRQKNRPRLKEAMQACRVYGAVLVIARLDRLSRNAHFLFGLQEAGVEFVCADMPFANRLTVGVMALVAEEEGRAISIRTKAALAAAKARGVKLGGDRGTTVSPEAARLGLDAIKARASRKARDITPIIAQIRAEGAVSLRAIAKGLNQRGVPAPRGGLWQAKSVQRVLERLIHP
jgi:DNA invertase Pin-like site-specific DNA recombinase